MVEHNLVPVSDDYYDVLVDADFAEDLAPSDVIKVSQIILEVSKSKAVDGIFFVGFVALEVGLEKVKAQFRFSKRQEDLAKLGAPDLDELPRKMARFTWHLFARVDSSYRLANATLPSGFRSYVNLDEYG
jgi:hypothetical protein